MKLRFPRQLIEEVHSQLHRTIYQKKADHKAEYYSWLCGYFIKELKHIKEALKEVSKQQKYLWETLDEMIEIKKTSQK